MRSALSTDILIRPLDAPDQRLAAMTYPRYRLLFQRPSPWPPQLIVLAAWRSDQPIGLVLGDIYEKMARILSVSVPLAERRQGIGLALMQAFEAEAQKRGAELIDARHTDRMARLRPWLSLLARSGWNDPEPMMVRLSGKTCWADRDPEEWSKLFVRLERQGFNIIAWAESSDDQKAQVTQENLEAPERLRFDQALLPTPELSLIIRQHDRVVGWILGRDASEPGHVHYPVGYVVPALQRGGWLIGALVLVCRLQSRLRGPDSIASYETTPDNMSMQSFMRRHLSNRGELLRTDIQYRTTKPLANRQTETD